MTDDYFSQEREINDYIRAFLQISPYERFLYLERRKRELYKLLPQEIKERILASRDISDEIT